MTVVRVGVLGWGAIGSAVGRRLLDDAIPGAELVAIATRTAPIDPPVPVVAAVDLATLCDVVVEAVGHAGLRDHVPALLAAGCRVIVVSSGALRDPDLLGEVTAAGSDRMTITSGAVGGLDIIEACRDSGEIHSIRLTTTKPPSTLVQPWMDEAMVTALDAGEEIVECFEGPADEAAGRFPSSVNVAATLALTAGSWDLIHVRVVGDPAATGNTHVIEIEADAGRYRVELANRPLPDNPKSSALVVASVLRNLSALVTNVGG
ncbi:MAG: aspartate dehydrogenase domain-containing protein [Actinomycetota bacterium]